MAKISNLFFSVLLFTLCFSSGCRNLKYSVEVVNSTDQTIENTISTTYFEDGTNFFFEHGGLVPADRGAAVQLWSRPRPLRFKVEYFDFEGEKHVLEEELSRESRAVMRRGAYVFLFIEKGQKLRLEVENN